MHRGLGSHQENVSQNDPNALIIMWVCYKLILRLGRGLHGQALTTQDADLNLILGHTVSMVHACNPSIETAEAESSPGLAGWPGSLDECGVLDSVRETDTVSSNKGDSSKGGSTSGLHILTVPRHLHTLTLGHVHTHITPPPHTHTQMSSLVLQKPCRDTLPNGILLMSLGSMMRSPTVPQGSTVSHWG